MSNSSALLSADGKYRYTLMRVIPGDLRGTAACLFVMNNPSTADHKEDDPTVRRVVDFADRWGYRYVFVGNTNPFRATNPNDAVIPPHGVVLKNEFHLKALAEKCQMIIVAWGTKANPVLVERTITVLLDAHPVLHALGISKDGHPKHPLYLAKTTIPVRWKAR